MNPLIDDIESGLALLPEKMRTPQRRVLLFATCRQENPNRAPRQLIKKDGKLMPIGPAAGDYQFELGGATRNVLVFHSTAGYAAVACQARGVAPKAEHVFAAIQTDPVLAAALAGLNYYTDPKPLPAVGDEAGAWALYLRVWRPGAYARQPEELRAKWRQSYAEALKAYGFNR